MKLMALDGNSLAYRAFFALPDTMKTIEGETTNAVFGFCYSFRRHIAIAKENHKALVIHDRDAHRAVLDLLMQEGAPEKTIFHCFSGDLEMAKECVSKGYFLSFAGTVTFKNAPELRQAAEFVPIELMLVETDSPFLCPMPNRGALNTPAQIPNTLRVIADVRGISADYLAAAISENSERIFGKF